MRKLFVIITGLFVFISIPVVVYFFGQQQEIRSKAAPATTLSIQPSANSIPIGETVVCKILINTGGNKVASAKVSVKFDQTKFEAQSITNGTLAPRILNQGTVGVGTATITVGAENTTKPITGTGDIATLRLKALAGSATPVTVQFGADTFVAGLGESTVNVLVSNQGANITITGGSASNNQTLSDNLSTGTPTPTTSIAPTLSTSPTPTTLSGAATNTPTPTTLVSTPTPTSAQPEIYSGDVAGNTGGTDVTTVEGEAIPTTGSTENTIALIGVASVLISFGLVSFLRATI